MHDNRNKEHELDAGAGREALEDVAWAVTSTPLLSVDSVSVLKILLDGFLLVLVKFHLWEIKGWI